jgi:pseudoazurin
MNRLIAAMAFGMAVAVAGAAGAAEHQVRMLNKGDKGSMVFQPALVRVAPGDTIKFVPTDKSHSAETIKGMLPDGAAEFKGKVNQEVTVTLDKEGVYGVKCPPHYGMGMVALIVVGQPVNAEQAKAIKQTGKAKAVFGKLFTEAAAN